jgi:ProP effector
MHLDAKTGPSGRPILKLNKTPEPPPPAETRKPTAEEAAAAIAEARRWLEATFPAAFGPQVKPLAIGAHREVMAKAFEAGRPLRWTRSALRRHTGSYTYLRALAAEGAWRHDLHGNTTETVAPEHREHAKEQLAEARVRRKEPAPKRTRGKDTKAG